MTFLVLPRVMFQLTVFCRSSINRYVDAAARVPTSAIAGVFPHCKAARNSARSSAPVKRSRREIATVLLSLPFPSPCSLPLACRSLALSRERKSPRNAFMAAIKARFLARSAKRLTVSRTYEEDRLIRRADEAVKRKVRGQGSLAEKRAV